MKFSPSRRRENVVSVARTCNFFQSRALKFSRIVLPVAHFRIDDLKVNIWPLQWGAYDKQHDHGQHGQSVIARSGSRTPHHLSQRCITFNNSQIVRDLSHKVCIVFYILRTNLHIISFFYFEYSNWNPEFQKAMSNSSSDHFKFGITLSLKMKQFSQRQRTCQLIIQL